MFLMMKSRIKSTRFFSRLTLRIVMVMVTMIITTISVGFAQTKTTHHPRSHHTHFSSCPSSHHHSSKRLHSYSYHAHALHKNPHNHHPYSRQSSHHGIHHVSYKSYKSQPENTDQNQILSHPIGFNNATLAYQKIDNTDNLASSPLSMPSDFPSEASDNIQVVENNNPLEENTTPLTTRARLVALIHRAIEGLHHTSYRLGGSYFDLSRGIYEEDCSGYVDQLLNLAEPQAYASLTHWTHSNKPSSFDYYDFFKKLPNNSWRFWQKIKDVARLKPGAILVFRYYGHSRYGSGGHVMVVMSEPVPIENHADTFLVRVSDSANSGHSDDTRARHTSGIGIGTLLLKVNPFTHEPTAYAWKLSGWLEHADVAMAEPITPA